MFNSTNVKVVKGSPTTKPRQAARKYIYIFLDILSLMITVSLFRGSCGEMLNDEEYVRGIKLNAKLVAFTNVIQKIVAMNVAVRLD